MASESPVPVTVLTGFLGSGKGCSAFASTRARGTAPLAGRIERGRTTIYSRRGQDWTRKFRRIADASDVASRKRIDAIRTNQSEFALTERAYSIPLQSSIVRRSARQSSDRRREANGRAVVLGSGSGLCRLNSARRT